jgi:hypothetical protein
VLPKSNTTSTSAINNSGAPMLPAITRASVRVGP